MHHNIIFADGHLHSNPIRGIGITSIGKKLVKNSCWFIALVSLPPHHLGYDNSFDGYIKSVEILIRECNTAKEIGLKTACLAGVHPATIEDEVSKDPKHGIKILEKAISVLNHIAKLVKDNIIDGFGEVGRPHYKTMPEAFIINNIITRYVLTLAKDLNAIVHLHLEQGGELTAIDIEKMISDTNINKNSVVLHHLDVATAKAAQVKDLVFTVPGKYHILKEVFKILKPRYMIESDFIDDPKRPGISSYPWDIIENQKKLLSEECVDEEYLYKLNIDIIAKIYDIKPP